MNFNITGKIINFNLNNSSEIINNALVLGHSIDFQKIYFLIDDKFIRPNLKVEALELSKIDYINLDLINIKSTIITKKIVSYSFIEMENIDNIDLKNIQYFVQKKELKNREKNIEYLKNAIAKENNIIKKLDLHYKIFNF